jgi:hypothetical protein
MKGIKTMSPKAGFILVQDIVPRIRRGVMRGVKTLGGEDIEELIQDATAHAALLLHRAEESGKEVSCGNIAYYALLHTRSGRRSTGGSRTDAMAPGTQLDGNSCLLSFEEPVGFDPETGEAVVLGEMLADNDADPSVAAARNIDWAEFLGGHNRRYTSMVMTAVNGKPLRSLKKKFRVSDSGISGLKHRLAADVREVMGEDVLDEVCRKPRWHGSLVVEHEKAACRAERNRA